MKFINLLALFTCSFCLQYAECTVTLDTDKGVEVLNSTILVQCTITGESLDGWYFKYTKTLITDHISERIHTTSKGDIHTLKIQYIEQGDGGKYECRAKSGKLATFTLWIQPQFRQPLASKQYLRLFTTDAIKVQVLGYPKPQVTWKDKNDKKINFALDRYEMLSDGSMRIKDVNRQDGGIYTVTYNQENMRIKSAKIEVIAMSPPVIVQGPHPLKRYVTKGYNTSFTCKVDGEPTPTVRWLEPSGREVSVSNPRYHIDKQTLFIYNIQTSDKGNWTCEASVGDVKVTTTVEILDVYEAPEIYQPSFPWVFYPVLYKEYTIVCRARGYPIPTVIIRKDGRIHPRLDMSKPGEALVRSYLIRTHDLGNYSCEAWSNARDSDGNTIVVKQIFAVFTKDKPYINPQGSPKEIFSYVGNPKPLKINCDFVSWPRANVTIWRGFYELTNGTDQATFYVWTYSWEDFGPYSCIGSNIYGEVNYTVWIRHARPPGKPTGVHLEASCDRAIVKWNKPEDNGGMEIERYVISDVNGHRFNTRDWFARWRLFGLSPNKEYTITIRAMNRQGPGLQSRVVFRTPHCQS